MGRSIRDINCEVTDSLPPPQNLKRERDGVVKRIVMFWPVALKIIDGQRRSNIQGGSLTGIVCEEAEEFFYTAMRFKDTKNVVDHVLITPENMSSFSDVIDRSADVAEDRKRSTFCQPRDKKVDLFIPKTRGGGKRLECTPYYQVPADGSTFIQVDESKPDILKAHTNMFLVRRANRGLIRKFLKCDEFEEYNEEESESTRTAATFLIFVRRRVPTLPTATRGSSE